MEKLVGFNSKHHDKFKFALKLIWLSTDSTLDLFPCCYVYYGRTRMTGLIRPPPLSEVSVKCATNRSTGIPSAISLPVILVQIKWAAAWQALRKFARGISKINAKFKMTKNRFMHQDTPLHLCLVHNKSPRLHCFHFLFPTKAVSQ